MDIHKVNRSVCISADNCKKTLVTVVCFVYNQERFVRQCLEGVLMQKTTFSFKILIYDDASTDRTADIVREYELKYSEIISAVYEAENTYSKGRIFERSVELFRKVNTKYIALCDGDDFWIDPNKLQNQVYFLEKHKDFSLCTTAYKSIVEGVVGSEKDVILSNKCTVFDSLIGNYWTILTSVFRVEALLKSDLYKNVRKFRFGRDAHLFFFLLQKGKGYYMPEITGVRCINQNGIFGSLTEREKYRIHYNVFQELYKVVKDKTIGNSLYNWIIKTILEKHFYKSKLEKYYLFFKFYKRVYICKIKKSIQRIRKSVNNSQ